MCGYSETEGLGTARRNFIPDSGRVRMRAPVKRHHRMMDDRLLDGADAAPEARDAKSRPLKISAAERDITALKRAARELRKLHARVTFAQESERRRIARELHDGVGQILSGVKFSLESLPGKIDLSGRAAAEILKVDGCLDHAIAEIRRVSHNLMPSELEDLGLDQALRALCRESKERAGVPVTVRSVPTAVPPELALALFRIAQEALNNIGKHSKATMAEVSLTREGRQLVLKVSDNGIGFVMGRRPSPGRGLGLGNMRERAESVGGSIEMRSYPGSGTSLRVRAPLAVPA